MLAAWTPGVPELIVIALIVLLLFGAKKVPEMARSLGKAQKEFKKGMDESAKDEGDDDAKPAPAATEESKPD